MTSGRARRCSLHARTHIEPFSKGKVAGDAYPLGNTNLTTLAAQIEQVATDKGLAVAPLRRSVKLLRRLGPNARSSS